MSPPHYRVAAANPIAASGKPTAGAKRSGRPLDGVTVVEFATVIAAPLGTSMLADLGARVIRVEPIEGDPFRGYERTNVKYKLANVKLLVPVIPPTFYAIGSNYRNHVIERSKVKGFKEPKDLIGKRVAGTNYSPASNIWMRGIFEEFWGLPHRSITWMTERAEDIDFKPPPGLKIELVPPGGPSLEDRVVSGEFDALLTPTLPKPFMAGNPNIKRLFENYRQVELDYWNKTKIFPIMHVTIIREDIVKQHPWAAPSLARAFDKAKALAYARVRNPRMVPLAWFSSYWDEQNELLGDDPWQYGLGPMNRHNLETILRYTHQQGLISRPMSVDELFVNTDEDGYGGAAGGD